MYKIDLNSDLGEAFGAYTMGLDSEIIRHISSANIACGWHAGDAMVMDATVRECKKAGVALGAHPGYPDLQGFGRRSMGVTAKEVKNYLTYQLGALSAFAQQNNMGIQHVKPHGAMYNMAAVDLELAMALAEAVYEVDKNIIFMGLANSKMIEAANNVGLRVASEVFADRAYNSDGTLVSRSQPGAVIHDTKLAIQRVIRMVKENKVEAINGEDIALVPTSICVHGDSPMAVDFVKEIREAFIKEKIQVVNLGELL